MTMARAIVAARMSDVGLDGRLGSGFGDFAVHKLVAGPVIACLAPLGADVLRNLLIACGRSDV
jgi:hypothetical protein